MSVQIFGPLVIFLVEMPGVSSSLKDVHSQHPSASVPTEFVDVEKYRLLVGDRFDPPTGEKKPKIHLRRLSSEMKDTDWAFGLLCVAPAREPAIDSAALLEREQHGVPLCILHNEGLDVIEQLRTAGAVV